MRSLFAAACLLWTLPAWGESLTVRVQESATIELAGATAAYTTNPVVADVSIVSPGVLSVIGNSSGKTQLVVVIGGRPQLFVITVAAPIAPLLARPEPGAPQVRYEGRYSSASTRTQNTIDVVSTNESRRSQVHILHIHDLRAEAGQPRDVLASIFYRYTTPGLDLTLLDAIVDVSPVTVRNAQLRGLHLRNGALEVHGGYASPTLYDSFFLPTERRWAGGVGYDIESGQTRWTPSVYGFFSAPDGTYARRGVVAAIAAEHVRGDELLARIDVGMSRSIAAAGELRYRSPRGQVRALFSFKPDDFPTLGLSEIAGTHGELDAAHHTARRLTLSSHGSFDRIELSGQTQSFSAGSVGLQYALSSRVTLNAGVDASEVRTQQAHIRTAGLPLGVSYEAAGFGASASYRLLHNSEASRRGDALRLNAHTSRGRFSANAWAERQRQAPTLDLIFGAAPGLELALLRLGISVHDPEDVAHALRDNPALIDLGYITGVNLDLTPRRLQAGVSLAWMERGSRGNHLRFLALYGRDDGIRTTRENLLSSLTWSRRVLAATDLYASVSWWRTTLNALPADGLAVDVGVKQQFSGMPAFLQRNGTIEGVVFLDPRMSGVRDAEAMTLAGIVVTLDGNRVTRTDSHGNYKFADVSPGPHRVAAQLPPSPRAFFTTPSQIEARVPAHVDFGLVWAAARIDGRLLSDSGQGLAGVIFTATAAGVPPSTTTSDSNGNFVLAVSPGPYRVSLAAASLPAGYSTPGETGEREIVVQSSEPQSLTFEVQAMRSVSGRAAGASEVRIGADAATPERTVPVDAAGNFVFRSMPAGTLILTARQGSRTLSTSVTLPDEPMILRDVMLTELAIAESQPPTARSKRPAPTAAVPVFASAGAYVVQAGAFRDKRNATSLLGGLRKAGEQAFALAQNGLMVVFAGPFSSRRAAVVASKRLERAGFEGFVTRR
ncbi:MAG: SPOR domain-containing protein [Acidobacteriota bacterium]